MYQITKYKLMLVQEGSFPTPDRRIADPQATAKMLASYFQGLDREHFAVILVNAKNVFIGINVVSIGHLSGSIVHPREVFKPAIIGNAHAIILAHNHPSGDVTPSQEDKEVTKILVEAGNILKIPVLDHIILGDNGEFYSFRNEGLL